MQKERIRGLTYVVQGEKRNVVVSIGGRDDGGAGNKCFFSLSTIFSLQVFLLFYFFLLSFTFVFFLSFLFFFFFFPICYLTLFFLRQLVIGKKGLLWLLLVLKMIVKLAIDVFFLPFFCFPLLCFFFLLLSN
jgi:hypothetical protein